MQIIRKYQKSLSKNVAKNMWKLATGRHEDFLKKEKLLSSSNAPHLTFTIINYIYFFVYISMHYNMAISNGTFELQTENRILAHKKRTAKIKIIEKFSSI